ncbi:Dehydrogenase/reductase SDR family member 1 [Hypsibius exemplaris]|uniref:Dehydrogenase/reductase SDR family member 1 n=1 Tax=Hypsibius exemplaris TaxID=2072580 RepID=A0A1W0X3E0_HYPEX|nr:Dehydrogenase/reductase SDR family member 1 [Hypsibius exemplaris]
MTVDDAPTNGDAPATNGFYKTAPRPKIPALLKVTGASLAGTTAADLLQAITHRVGVVLELRNYTKWNLTNPIVIINAGQIKTAPSDVHAGQREIMAAHKTDHTATGSSGTVSWNVDGTGQRVVIMWSAPYSFDFHTNWLAVGVMDASSLHLLGENTFNEMYKSEESWFKRKEFYRDTTQVRFAADQFEVTGSMGCAESDLRAWPTNVEHVDVITSRRSSRVSTWGKVALVTGASRGIGKGIALQLGEAGATVYITGRTLEDGDSPAPGSLRHTAQEIEKRGGKAVPIACDHNNDEDVAKVFQQIQRDHKRLDILVNNAYAAVDFILKNNGKPFWEFPDNTWDIVNGVGLRNHFLCSTLAARMMVKQRSGLIVNVSSAGGKTYLFTPSYGIGKAAVDRMAADCGLELKAHNVTYVSLWPGAVKTELIIQDTEHRKTGAGSANASSTETLELGANARMWDQVADGESPEFAGKAVVALATDPKLIERTGQIVTTAALGQEFGFKDIDGRKIKWTMPAPNHSEK